MQRKIKVLIVDDSILFRSTLTKFLSENSDIEVVGTASDPFEASEKILKYRPDVITLDVEMPKMNGIEFLKRLIPQYPIPAVIVSSAPIMAFDALDAGAVDYIKKPVLKTVNDMKAFADELKGKIATASNAKVKQKKSAATYKKGNYESHVNYANSKIVIAMGTSTGGTDALQVVLSEIPVNCPPIVIVQHMPPVFTRMFAERLNKICDIEIKEAKDGDRLKSGLALLAPGDFHMKLKKDSRGYYVRVEHGDKVSGHCPSVDVLFSSVAQSAGRDSIGVIMTGMGADGALGLKQMHETGAFTIGQDRDSCVVYGMPMMAYKMGACSIQAPLDRISETILKRLNSSL